jgi:type II secretory pathway pseudopilin PulG
MNDRIKRRSPVHCLQPLSTRKYPFDHVTSSCQPDAVCVRGYALIAALLMVVAASLAAALVVHRAKTEAQREREAELLFIGDQYRQALRSYYAQRPGGSAPQFPATLKELLVDTRFPQPVRHLRRIFVDPLTGQADWVLERSQGRIVGVHSRSEAAPLRHANFGADDAAFAGAASYAQWIFSAPQSAIAAAGAPSAAGDSNGNGSAGSTPAPATNPIESAAAACAAKFLGPGATAPCDALKSDPAAQRACLYNIQRQFADCLASASGG